MGAESSRIINLQVGEKKFCTTDATLTSESAFFKTYISQSTPTCIDGARDSNNCYFVDADPDLFEHILRYLRRGVFPIFYDSVHDCWDFAKYIALEREAAYFQIPKLVKWINEEQYKKGVIVKQHAEVLVEGNDAFRDRRHQIVLEKYLEEHDLKDVKIYPHWAEENNGDVRAIMVVGKEIKIQPDVFTLYLPKS